MPLFLSHFPTRIRLAVRKYCSCGRAVDYPVDSIKSRFGCSPLLNHDYRPISKFRGYSTRVLARENMTPTFEDIELKETYVPSLSGQRRGTQNATRIYGAYIIFVFTATPVVLQYIEHYTVNVT